MKCAKPAACWKAAGFLSNKSRYSGLKIRNSNIGSDVEFNRHHSAVNGGCGWGQGCRTAAFCCGRRGCPACGRRAVGKSSGPMGPADIASARSFGPFGPASASASLSRQHARHTQDTPDTLALLKPCGVLMTIGVLALRGQCGDSPKDLLRPFCALRLWRIATNLQVNDCAMLFLVFLVLRLWQVRQGDPQQGGLDRLSWLSAIRYPRSSNHGQPLMRKCVAATLSGRVARAIQASSARDLPVCVSVADEAYEDRSSAKRC